MDTVKSSYLLIPVNSVKRVAVPGGGEVRAARDGVGMGLGLGRQGGGT